MRAALGLVAVVLGAVPFLTLLVLVQTSWGPLQALDGDVAAELNDFVARSPVAVDVLRVLTDGGGTGTSVYVLVLATLWLLIRHQRRLATYVAVTGLGLAVLVPVSKALVGRARPDVALPVVNLPTNASFPSGHAMTSLVTWGVLVLVALPALSGRRRRVVLAAAALLVLVVGLTRLALGVHFVSDVVAGWALGAAWLGTTTAAFRGWQHDATAGAPPRLTPWSPTSPALRLAPSRERVLPSGRATVARVGLAWLGLLAGLSTLGLLLTTVLRATLVGGVDDRALAAVIGWRTDDRNRLAEAVSLLSGTRTVVLVSVAMAVLALAATRTWRPVLFVALAVLGEVGLYFVTAQVVQRARPDVPDLTSGLPVGASYPSGHTAAAVVVYGTLAALVVTYGRGRWRWASVVLPLLVAPAVGLSRVYLAAHHPTDVLAGLLLGTAWVLALVRLLPADRDGAQGSGRSAPGASRVDRRQAQVTGARR